METLHIRVLYLCYYSLQVLIIDIVKYAAKNGGDFDSFYNKAKPSEPHYLRYGAHACHEF
jgi:hypothetical protein